MDVAINAAASRPASSLYQTKAVDESAQQPAAAAPTETKVTISDAAKEMYAASESTLNTTESLGGGTVSTMNTGLLPPPPPPPPPVDPEKDN